jgi:hypothetical protein
MRSLIVFVVLFASACGGAGYVAQPDYSFSHYRSSGSSQSTGGALLLAPAGASTDRTAAFLAAFCSWVSSTPAVSEKYAVVYLLPTVEGDPLADAQKQLDDVAKLVSNKAKNKQTQMSLFDLVQERGDTYRCGGRASAVVDPTLITVLQVAHGSLEPYGVGLRYFSSTTGRSTRRGFFPLRNKDLADDTRRFAALALSEVPEAIRVEATLRSAPEARCRDGREGWCIYQPSTVRIAFEPHDSPYLNSGEVSALTLDHWTISRAVERRDVAKLVPLQSWPWRESELFLAKAGAVVLTPVHEGNGLAVDFHARRAGTYLITAYFQASGVPGVVRALPIKIRVEPGALLVIEGAPISDAKAIVERWVKDFGLPSFDPVKRELDPIRVDAACLTTFIFCKLRDELDYVEHAAVASLGGYRLISGAFVDSAADELRRQLRAEVRDASGTWQQAVEGAISDDAVRDGLRLVVYRPDDRVGNTQRNQFHREQVPFAWCESIAESALQYQFEAARESISRIDVGKWSAACRKAFTDVIDQAFKQRQRVSTFDTWGTGPRTAAQGARSDWLRVTDGQEVHDTDTHWIRPRATTSTDQSLNKSNHQFGARLVPVDEDGAAADSIDMWVDARGGRTTFRGFFYGNVLWDHGTRSAGLGTHVEASIYEFVSPFFEWESTDRSRWRVGFSTSPWCLDDESRNFCRKLLFELEYAATWRGLDQAPASSFGGRVSVWRHDSMIGVYGIGLTAWGRVGRKESSAGIGAGFGFY